MARNRRGSIWKDREGNLYGRITFVDQTGKRRDRKRKALTGTKREAWNHVSDLLRELDEHGEQTIDAARMTFKSLAAYYEEHYLVPPVYDEKGNKVEGLRTWKDYRRKLKPLVLKFGRRLLRDITYADLKRWRTERLKTPTKQDARRHEKAIKTDPEAKLLCTRALATVNRELTVLNRAFSIAYQNRWILRNPFDDGDPLFDIVNEKQRERIATDDEEEALLAACVDEREHLLAFLMCAFDTGMRAAEIYNLTPDMVDLETRTIIAVSYKGKKRRERAYTMTPRVEAEFRKLIEGRTFAKGETIFRFKSFKRSFNTAKRLAGLEGFRLHDVRHTTATRLVDGNMHLGKVGKLLGHTNPSTTWRYVHTDRAAQEEAANILSNRKKKG